MTSKSNISLKSNRYIRISLSEGQIFVYKLICAPFSFIWILVSEFYTNLYNWQSLYYCAFLAMEVTLCTHQCVYQQRSHYAHSPCTYWLWVESNWCCMEPLSSWRADSWPLPSCMWMETKVQSTSRREALLFIHFFIVQLSLDSIIKHINSIKQMITVHSHELQYSCVSLTFRFQNMVTCHVTCLESPAVGKQWV